MRIGYVARCTGLTWDKMVILDIFLFIKYTEVQHLLRTSCYIYSVSGMLLGANVKPSGLTPSFKVCFRRDVSLRARNLVSRRYLGCFGSFEHSGMFRWITAYLYLLSHSSGKFSMLKWLAISLYKYILDWWYYIVTWHWLSLYDRIDYATIFIYL